MSTASCVKSFSLEVTGTVVDCMGHPQAVADLVWVESAPTFNMVGGVGSFSNAGSAPISVGTETAFLCNPTVDFYLLTVQFDWTFFSSALFPESQPRFSIDGNDYYGPIFAGSGTVSHTFYVNVFPGISVNLGLYVTCGGFNIGPITTSLSGTVTILPLTPP